MTRVILRTTGKSIEGERRDDRFGLSQWDMSAAEVIAIAAEAEAIAPALRPEAVHTGDIGAL
jgi:hypothetical protein